MVRSPPTCAGTCLEISKGAEASSAASAALPAEAEPTFWMMMTEEGCRNMRRSHLAERRCRLFCSALMSSRSPAKISRRVSDDAMARAGRIFLLALRPGNWCDPALFVLLWLPMQGVADAGAHHTLTLL